MPAMTSEEMRQFLSLPLVGVLTTIKPDGSPHAAPIWYEYADGKFYLWTGASSVKVRNIRSNPKAALCIATHEEPYRYVVAEGTCVVSRSEVPSRCYSITKRYYGEARGSEYVRADLEAGDAVVIVLTPLGIISESAA